MIAAAVAASMEKALAKSFQFEQDASKPIPRTMIPPGNAPTPLNAIGKARLWDHNLSTRIHLPAIDSISLGDRTVAKFSNVYTMAWALNDIHLHDIRESKEKKIRTYRSKVNSYLKKVRYTDLAGNDIFFNEKGELPTSYKILNWVTKFHGDKLEFTNDQVGLFNESHADDQQIIIEEWKILWKNDK
ncbi:Hypothetical predicted protein, partial [Pelobates cultripes]